MSTTTQQWNQTCYCHQLWCHHHFSLLICPWQKWFLLSLSVSIYFSTFCGLVSWIDLCFVFEGWKVWWLFCLILGKVADVILGFDSIESYVVSFIDPFVLVWLSFLFASAAESRDFDSFSWEVLFGFWENIEVWCIKDWSVRLSSSPHTGVRHCQS